METFLYGTSMCYGKLCASLVGNDRFISMPVLPEHMHCVRTLPPDDDDFSNRWKAIKIRFVKSVAPVEKRSPSRCRRGERGIWQRRFWEHAIRNEEDYARHVDYVHFNPVKHGLVKVVREWPYSSFHRWVQRGIYPIDWGCMVMDDFEVGERE